MSDWTNLTLIHTLEERIYMVRNRLMFLNHSLEQYGGTLQFYSEFRNEKEKLDGELNELLRKRAAR